MTGQTEQLVAGEITLRVPACRWWSANSRKKHLHTSDWTREWRETSTAMARQLHGYLGRPPPLDHFDIWAELAFGDNYTNRDPHNYMDTVVKPCIDGLVPILIVGDTQRHLRWTAIRRHPRDRRGSTVLPGVYLTVKPISEEEART